MHGGRGTGASIGGVAFRDGSVYLSDKISDQLRTEVVAGGRFAGGNLDRCLTGRGPVQLLIQMNKSFWGNILCKVNDGRTGGWFFIFDAGQGTDLLRAF